MNKEYASNFFEYLNKLYEFNKLNNSDFEITPNMIYTILINYGVIEKEDIEPLFILPDMLCVFFLVFGDFNALFRTRNNFFGKVDLIRDKELNGYNKKVNKT